MTVNQFRSKLTAINVTILAEDAMYDSRQEIYDLQVDQLKHGIRKDGTKIGKYRNTKYAAKKFAQNSLAGFGNMDWILTGALKYAIFVDVRPETFVIDSADIKAAKLIGDFGDPFGLTVQSKEKLIVDKLRFALINEAKQKLQL